MSSDVANREATLFPTRDADLYIERAPYGLPGKSFQGDSYFTAPNPPFGAMFTYYLKDELKSRKKQRWETESKGHRQRAGETAELSDARAASRSRSASSTRRSFSSSPTKRAMSFAASPGR